MSQFINLNRVMESGDHFKNEESLKIMMNRKSIVKKVFLLFAAFFFCAVNMFAQDVVTLKNGEDIEAFVQEIGEVDVKYKKFDNPNGPNYTLKKAEIFMIRYANGSKDVFVDNVAPAEPTETTTAKPSTQSQALPQNVQANITQDNKTVEPPTTKKQTPSSRVLIIEDMKTYNPNLYSQYKSGKRKSTAGLWLSSGGGALAGVALGSYFGDKEMTDDRIAMITIGAAIAVVGITLGVSGDIKQNRAVKNFKNQFYSQSGSPYFRFNVHSNKIGFAYVF